MRPAPDGLRRARLFPVIGVDFVPAARARGPLDEARGRSDQESAFRRADSLWAEAHRALSHAAADAEVWRHALAISSFSPSITPAVLCERFIQELFIDLHAAVFESLFAAAVAPPPDHRLFVHCTYVERLIDL